MHHDLSLYKCYSGAVNSIIYVENGKSVSLNPNIQGNPEDILWTFNGNKVAEHDLNEFLEYGQFRGRSEIHITTGQLNVLLMTSQDSGIYSSVIQIDGKLQNSENEVQVIGKWLFVIENEKDTDISTDLILAWLAYPHNHNHPQLMHNW